jgi:UDPglucose--hexose-1-phosphate uridylyltransferase
VDKSELRRDPLTGAWTLFAEARLQRPAFPSVRTEPAPPDPFRAGREPFAPHTLHEAHDAAGWQVRVVPNRLPLLRVEGDPTPRADGFYDRMAGVGAHEVIIEDPGDRPLEALPLAALGRVIAAWQARMLDLLRDPRLRSFFIVKNVGRPAGGHTAHSVSQLVALALVPPALRRKLETARAFFAAKKRALFEDLLAEEVRTATRLVYENNGFTVFCPYAARGPFELAIYPKRQNPDFHAVSSEERTQLADVLRTALRKLNRALDHPPYNLLLTTAPTRPPRAGQWDTLEHDFRWHLEILPRLDHLGGLELATGCWLNSVWPEVAADTLRQTEVAE